MLSANNDKPANALSTPVFNMPTSTTTSSKAYYRMDSHERRGVETQPLQHIWIVTGPAGSGKTTVAQKLQAELGLPYLEGDDVRFSSFFPFFSFYVTDR
jgi:gluconokinase